MVKTNARKADALGRLEKQRGHMFTVVDIDARTGQELRRGLCLATFDGDPQTTTVADYFRWQLKHSTQAPNLLALAEALPDPEEGD